VAAVFVLLICILNGLLLYGDDERGSFGDMFGAANALFAGLAFAGLIYTLLLQRKELGLQRKELELTRQELKGQRAQMEIQNQTMHKQAFESTFFQLIRLHNDIVASQTYSYGEMMPVTGRGCFTYWFSDFRGSYVKLDDELPVGPTSDAVALKTIKESYAEFYKRRQSVVGHYFRNLQNIIQFVKNSNIDDKHIYIYL